MLSRLLSLALFLPFAPVAYPISTPIQALVSSSAKPDAGPNSAVKVDGATSSTAMLVTVPNLERVVVLGASVSDGFGLDLDVGARATLVDVLQATTKAKHEPVQSAASSMLFTDVLRGGRGQIDFAKSKKPTLVVGIDYLFWFAYGVVPAEQERLDRFEKGLSMIEELGCTVVVGDVPDMSQALHGESVMTHAPLLFPAQVPAPETLAKVNERLASWAAKHTNVIVVPLASLLTRMHAGEEIALHGNVLAKDSEKVLFQTDLLHPTLRGSVAVSLFALDCLVHAQPAIPADAFDWDIASITKKVYDAKEPDRQAKAERERKKTERAKAKAPAEAGTKG
jgi:hypothetical protein